MSDFLSNLAARALGRAETVQPRPVHIFEPAPAAGDFMYDPLAGTPPAKTVEDKTDLRLEEDRVGEASALPTLPRGPNGTPVKQPESTISFQSRDRRQEQPKVDAHSSKVPLNEQAHLPVLNEAHITPASESPAQDSDDHADGFESPSRADNGPTFVPRGAVRVTSVRTPSRRVEAEPDSPSIRVTIGRIDVRAVMTAAPQPRPAPASRAPKVTLEDYLKQRSGGRG